jgi:hypothetical protein
MIDARRVRVRRYGEIDAGVVDLGNADVEV